MPIRTLKAGRFTRKPREETTDKPEAHVPILEDFLPETEEEKKRVFAAHVTHLVDLYRKVLKPSAEIMGLKDTDEDIPIRGVYEYGIVFGSYATQLMFMRSAERKLGKFRGFAPIHPEDQMFKYHITYKYTGGPRRKRFEAREALREVLGKRKVLLGNARKVDLHKFILLTSNEDQELLKEIGFRDLEMFWRTARESKIPSFLVKEQTKLRLN